MSVNMIIMWLVAIGIIMGGIDKIIGNRFGLGEKFEDGFNAMGPLALSMVGIVCLAPVIAKYVAPLIIPLLSAIGADPAIFGSILPNDTGGYALAMELAVNTEAGLFSGLIVASMLGCTVAVIVPIGLGLMEKKDHPYFAQGLLYGLISVPVASIIGGAVAGFNMRMVIMNCIPVIVISILLALGLKLFPNGMINGCIGFGKFIILMCTVGIIAGGFEYITGMVIIPGMAPIMDGLEIIGMIGVVLLGTFPLLHLLTKVLDKPLTALGKKLHLDGSSTTGLIFIIANPIPVFKMFSEMSSRGKILCSAWMVPVAAVLGDHLGFTAGVYPQAIAPMVAAKVSGGLLAFALAFTMTRSTEAVDRQSKEIQDAQERKTMLER